MIGNHAAPQRASCRRAACDKSLQNCPILNRDPLRDDPKVNTIQKRYEDSRG